MTNYTLAELQAMPNNDLNALAAELRGWTLQAVTDPIRGSFLNWVDSDDVGQYSPDEWTPATDRNQSGKLLEWFMTQNESCSFSIIRGRVTCRVRLESTEDTSEVWREREESLARLEALAFCAAMLVMKGALQ